MKKYSKEPLLSEEQQAERDRKLVERSEEREKNRIELPAIQHSAPHQAFQEDIVWWGPISSFGFRVVFLQYEHSFQTCIGNKH